MINCHNFSLERKLLQTQWKVCCNQGEGWVDMFTEITQCQFCRTTINVQMPFLNSSADFLVISLK